MCVRVSEGWRLFLCRSVVSHAQAEEAVISRLRRECGTEFTAKMQRMFTGFDVRTF